LALSVLKKGNGFILLGYVLLSSIGSLHAGEKIREGGTVYNYQQLKKEAAQGMKVPRMAIDITFNATLDAIFYASAANKMAAGDKFIPFFCTPKDYQMNGSVLEGVVDSYINKSSKGVSPNDSIGLISVLALRDRFPCN
jgi:hypothetical protein